MMSRASLAWIATLLWCGCQATPARPPAPAPPVAPQESRPQAPLVSVAAAPIWSYEVVARYPHDTQAFTQGLLFDAKGQLWESTGLKGKSTLRKVDLKSGKADIVQRLPADEFGEGLAVLGDQLFWLTWQNQRCHRFTWPALQKLPDFSYEGEGWGLCSDPQGHLWMSNGSSRLVRRAPKDFRVERELQVGNQGKATTMLNELEWVEGQIYANVYMTPLVACVDPSDGSVEGYVDFSGLLSDQQAAEADVLNGIAYDARHKRLFITGKLWPTLFEVRVLR